MRNHIHGYIFCREFFEPRQSIRVRSDYSLKTQVYERTAPQDDKGVSDSWASLPGGQEGEYTLEKGRTMVGEENGKLTASSEISLQVSVLPNIFTQPYVHTGTSFIHFPLSHQPRESLYQRQAWVQDPTFKHTSTNTGKCWESSSKEQIDSKWGRRRSLPEEIICKPENLTWSGKNSTPHKGPIFTSVVGDSLTRLKNHQLQRKNMSVTLTELDAWFFWH